MENNMGDDELRELAYSAQEEAMSFGLSHDTFLRYFKTVRERCAQAVEAAGPKEGPLKLVSDGFAAAVRGNADAATPSHPAGDTKDHAEFAVWNDDGTFCADASGPREWALAEARRYAAQYAQDGPGYIEEVKRTVVERFDADGVKVRVPWGSWTPGGDWHHNPELKMTAAEQRAANEAAGYACPGTDGVPGAATITGENDELRSNPRAIRNGQSQLQRSSGSDAPAGRGAGGSDQGPLADAAGGPSGAGRQGFCALQAEEVAELLPRIDAAIERITSGSAPMRVPADNTDPDLVLADCKRLLTHACGVAAPLAMQPVAWRYPIGGGRYAATTSEEEARRASTDGTVDALGIIPDGVLGKESHRG